MGLVELARLARLVGMVRLEPLVVGGVVELVLGLVGLALSGMVEMVGMVVLIP